MDCWSVPFVAFCYYPECSKYPKWRENRSRRLSISVKKSTVWRVEGGSGGTQFGRLDKKPGTLQYILCGIHSPSHNHPTVFPSWSVDISFKDDGTVILLLGVSFVVFKGRFFSIFSFYVLYSTLLYLPPLRFHCVEGTNPGLLRHWHWQPASG